jgi:hypothetical protein
MCEKKGIDFLKRITNDRQIYQRKNRKAGSHEKESISNSQRIHSNEDRNEQQTSSSHGVPMPVAEYRSYHDEVNVQSNGGWKKVQKSKRQQQQSTAINSNQQQQQQQQQR